MNHNKVIIGFIIVLVLIAQMTWATDLKPAAEWIRLGAALDGSRTDYVDFKAIRKDQSGLIRLWVKSDFVKPIKTSDGKSYTTIIVSKALNCRNYTIATTTVKLYNKAGNLITGADYDRNSWKFSEPSPDSVDGALMGTHCNH